MFSVLHYTDADRWSELLKNAGADDVFFTPEYHKANEVIIPGQAECFVYCEHGLLMMYPYIRRSIADTSWFDITSAYGYGGYIQHPRGRDGTGFHRTFAEYCRSEGIVSEFVRFHPLQGNHEWGEDPALKLVYHQPVVSIEYDRPGFRLEDTVRKEVWKKLNKAQKHDLTVVCDVVGRYAEDFVRIYRCNMALKNAGKFYFFEEQFFSLLRELLKEEVVVFVALHRDRVVAGLLVLCRGASAYNLLSCSELEYENWGANDFLQFSAVEWAYRRGVRSYVLGGGRGGEDSLFRFKAKFSPGRRPYYIGTRVHEARVYEELCRRRLGANSSDGEQPARVFPGYRS